MNKGAKRYRTTPANNMLDTDRYAGKKRKKPAQKHKPPMDATKSNPSKRHRDRLNGELDRLTNMLPFPENVRSRLDKLSVLRLSVGYLNAKSFFNATVKKNSLEFIARNGSENTSTSTIGFSEGELLLQALNGFILVVTAEGYVFYASPTIQEYLGFHQSDMIHQSVFEFIHIDDRAMFRRQLHFALNPKFLDVNNDCDGTQRSSDITRNIVTYDPQHVPPENSSFLERSFECRFRCLLDNSSGFLKLNFQGRLKFLHGQQRKSEDGNLVQPQLALFAIATPVQPPAILEIRTKTLIFQTKHKLDFTPVGIDSRGKIVLGYTELELCMRGSGYQFIHAADMMHCADNHVRMIKTGESGMTVFRLLTKSGGWVWVQANARLIYKGGRPDFIIARQRALVNAEGEEHLRQRKMQLPFNFATGEAVLYDTWPSLDIKNPHCDKDPSVQNAVDQRALHPNSLLASIQSQNKSIYMQHTEPQFKVDEAFKDSWALFNVPSHAVQDEATTDKDTIVSMIETLEQLTHDRDLSLAVQQMEMDRTDLNEWENALLRLTKDSNGNDKAISLDEILTNDILSYVEDALQRENNDSSLFQPHTTISIKPESFEEPRGIFSSLAALSGCAVRDHGLGSLGTAKINAEKKLNLRPPSDFEVTQKNTNVDRGLQSCVPIGPEDTSHLNTFAPSDQTNSFTSGSKEFIFQTQMQNSISATSCKPTFNSWEPQKVCESGKNISELLQSSTVFSDQFWPVQSSHLPHNHLPKLRQPAGNRWNKMVLSPENQNASVTSPEISSCPKFPQQNQLHDGEKSNNLANSVYHSPPNGLTADQFSPLSNFMFESHSPSSTNTIQQHSQIHQIHSPERHHLHTNLIYQKSPSETSCHLQWMPNELMTGTSLVPQGGVCISPSCQITPEIDSHKVLQRYLSCNGRIQVETHPVEEGTTFSCPPLVNELYISENYKASCYNLPIHVSNAGGHQDLD